jgi:chromate transporter
VILWELFYSFFLIGAFTFGGGYAMFPLVREQALAHGWLDAAQLVDFVAVSESTPGPFAVNMATYVGAQTAGVPGALCATVGVVLPSFLIILLVARFLRAFRDNRIVRGCMSGLKPAAVGLIASAVLSVALTVFVPDAPALPSLTEPVFWVSAAVFAAAAALLFWKKPHPVAVLGISAALGVAAGYALGL